MERVNKSKTKPGDRHGKLTAVCRDWSVDNSKNAYWIVLCDCGKTKTMQGSQLRGGATDSCGCNLEKKRGAPRETHGMTKSREYKIWVGMVSRCGSDNPSTKEYYSNKGISVSEEWRRSFETFYADMGDCPEGCSLDRKDSAGNYSKENCRWADNTTQARNRGMHKNNSSGRKGVHSTPHGKWVAKIGENGKQTYLGTFCTIEEAILARKSAEIRLGY